MAFRNLPAIQAIGIQHPRRMMSDSVQYPPGYLEEDHGRRVIAACSVILVITTVLLPLRFYARSLAPGQRAWDDHLLIPAYVLLLGLVACLYGKSAEAYS